MNRRKLLQLLMTSLASSALSINNIFNNEKGLPKVLILGDSISIGYTLFVQEILSEKAVVQRPMRNTENAENCQGTNNGIESIDRWLGNTTWDVIHFNFGLHDLKHVDPNTLKNSKDPKHPRQANPNRYKKQLTEITEKIISSCRIPIFATTTPYPENLTGPLREYGDEVLYNRKALKIMQKKNVIINDLHQFVLPQMDDLMIPNNVHFTKEGSEILAYEVAKHILSALKELA